MNCSKSSSGPCGGCGRLCSVVSGTAVQFHLAGHHAIRLCNRCVAEIRKVKR